MHVHVFCGNGEAKFWLEPEIALAENAGLPSKQLGEVERIIGERRDEIATRWKQHLRR